jgi:hypothetical protein
MSNAERKIMEKVYACINRMSGMTPTNPAYLEIKARCNEAQCDCCRELVRCLSSLNFRDLDLSDEAADRAVAVLRRHDERGGK